MLLLFSHSTCAVYSDDGGRYCNYELFLSQLVPLFHRDANNSWYLQTHSEQNNLHWSIARQVKGKISIFYFGVNCPFNMWCHRLSLMYNIYLLHWGNKVTLIQKDLSPTFKANPPITSHYLLYSWSSFLFLGCVWFLCSNKLVLIR